MISNFQYLLLCVAAVACCAAGGCKTCSQAAVDADVMRCREQCQAGLDAARHGRDVGAEEMYAAAVESCADDERARCLYAEALWHKGETDKAIEQMAEAARLSGGEPETMVRLGQMYLARGDIVAAQRQAAHAIASAPQLAEAWALEGDVLARGEQFDKALARYHRALAYRSIYPEVQFAVADIYAQQGRHARALATLAALSQQFPPDRIPQRLYVMRARTYRGMRRFDEAATEFSLAAKSAPPTSDLLFELADTLAAAGETNAARMTAEQALTIQPGHAQSRQLIADLAQPSSPGVRRY